MFRNVYWRSNKNKYTGARPIAMSIELYMVKSKKLIFQLLFTFSASAKKDSLWMKSEKAKSFFSTYFPTKCSDTFYTNKLTWLFFAVLIHKRGCFKARIGSRQKRWDQNLHIGPVPGALHVKTSLLTTTSVLYLGFEGHPEPKCNVKKYQKFL